MSEFHVEVTRVKGVQKHPNADTLSIAEVNGYPVIFRTGDFEEDGLAVHVPVDSIVPDTEDWAFLNGSRRIKAKKLRGVFSMGMLAKAKPEWVEGQNVQAELGIEKYEPAIYCTGGSGVKKLGLSLGLENESDPGFLPVYTDIEGYRKHKRCLVDGEEVVLTEKCHGCNGRAVFRNGRLWVGSHKNIKKFNEKNLWWKVAIDNKLEEKLAQVPNIAIYFEVYGQVQDLKYGVDGVKLVLFDAMNTNDRKYFDYDDFRVLATRLDLPVVPELYRGAWSADLLSMSEGKTTFPGADHVREGVVIKPVKERWDHKVGRVVLKMVGEGYLLRKGA